MPPSHTDPGNAGGSPVRVSRDGVGVRVSVAPGASRNRVEGVRADADGRQMIRVAVTAPPEGGKANAAVICLLAGTWGMPRSALAVTAGGTGRTKTVTVTGDPLRVTERLTAWTETLD